MQSALCEVAFDSTCNKVTDSDQTNIAYTPLPGVNEPASPFQHANPQLNVIGFNKQPASRWHGASTYDRCQNTDIQI